ncbi:ABC transporter ATP-binding protein [Heliobacterium chlorum]|uniref:ABC transporter ATP-binding protein n=1 Tax=Heliobacterium chlorum TaxID=2698 RepID=A0ABR7T3Y1_HELCL|nr:ABC transporter ATP-binding protein [Heliobacterium chlorum]MBC9785488.1 ABC transporter ATP-binding protein [Heliobacterium chlorum]
MNTVQEPAHLTIQQLTKTFKVKDGDVAALKDINLTVREGEFISIVGSSGCGKSTMLRIIAGLETQFEGILRLGGQPIAEPGLDRGFVFQEHRLLPWLTVRENVAFGLLTNPKEDQDKLIQEHIDLVELKGFEKAYPHQLSGGMAQRAAIARALVNRPQVLLLDEPFGALDALTKIQMQEEILRIWQLEKMTMILVTHDIDEAIYLGDRVVIMSSRPGRIKKIVPVEMGRPRDRNSSHFNQIRKTVYSEFFSEQEQPFVYSI